MVRQVRIAREALAAADLPDFRDSFDQFDDFLFCVEPSVSADLDTRRSAGRRPRRRKPCNRRSRRDTDRRHLADADWLNDEPGAVP
jgi:hypothetical protein